MWKSFVDSIKSICKSSFEILKETLVATVTGVAKWLYALLTGISKCVYVLGKAILEKLIALINKM